MALIKLKPRFQLSGLVADPDGLYDGSFVAACCRWWNHEVGSRSDLQKAGYRAFTPDEARELSEVPPPEGKTMLHAVAATVGLEGRQSNGAVALAYAFAVTIEAAAAQAITVEDFPTAATRTRAPRSMTPDDLEELDRHYSAEGVLGHKCDQWAPYWQLAGSLLADKVAEKTIRSLKAAYDDQVDRWQAAEGGLEIRSIISAPDFSLSSTDEGGGFLTNCIELLFEWGGRLRLGDRIITSGLEISELRFVSSELDYLDHLYDEAYERYMELASTDPVPVSEDIQFVASMCSRWLGEELDDHARGWISTAVYRGYLWRKVEVEDGAVGQLEPKLSEVVRESLTVGEDRSPDEPRHVTLYFTALCVADSVSLAEGSLGGFLNGRHFFERALWEALDDFDERGSGLDEAIRREAFRLGVALADGERALDGGKPSTLA